jgi:hypothetical protein
MTLRTGWAFGNCTFDGDALLNEDVVEDEIANLTWKLE